MLIKRLCVCLFIFTITVSSQNSANKLIDSLKNILKTTTEIKQTANTYNNIGKVFNSVNTDSAIVYLKKGEVISEKNNLTRHLFQSYTNIGTTFIKTGKLDSSEVYFNKAKNLLQKVDHYNALTSYYGDRGILDYYKGDFNNSGIRFEKALDLAIKEKNIQDIIRYSNNTALVLSKTGNNNKALDIYFKALKAAEKEKDSTHIGLLINNIANIYEDMNESDKALSLYQKSLEIKKTHGTFIQVINAYFNVANIQLEIGEKESDSLLIIKSKKNYQKVLEISIEKKYGNGKLIGWEGLGKIALHYFDYKKSEGYFKRILNEVKSTPNKPYQNMAMLSLAHIKVQEKKYSQAENYLLKVKNFVEKSGTITQKKQLFENLNLVYKNKKQYKKAYEYLFKLKTIQESLTSNEIKEKISNYEVKYETEKKEKEIAIQKEQLLENELTIKNRNLYAILITAALLIVAILSFGFYKRNQFRRKQLQKEIDLKDALSTIKTQNKLQEQRLRISRDLHDNIGSQLTFIISSIDNLKFVTKDANEKFKNKLSSISSFTSDTIFQLRDTIWAMNKSEISVEDLHARILSFIEKAKSATENVEFILKNDVNQDIKFTSLIGVNIFRVVQEAINNSIKYAEASAIKIELAEENNQITISINDNGKGFNLNSITLGNGLSNIEKRMSEVGGKAFIDSQEKNGTEIKIIYNL